jgi:hypothetical protein
LTIVDFGFLNEEEDGTSGTGRSADCHLCEQHQNRRRWLRFFEIKNQQSSLITHQSSLINRHSSIVNRSGHRSGGILWGEAEDAPAFQCLFQ